MPILDAFDVLYDPNSCDRSLFYRRNVQAHCELLTFDGGASEQ